MSVFMKQYGRTVLCCMAAALVLGVVFCVRANGAVGLIPIVYGKAMEGRTDMDLAEYMDAAAFNAAAREKPVILFQCKKIRPQEAVDVTSMFTARDAEQNEAAIEITDVLDEFGNSILYLTQKDRENKLPSYAADSFVFPAVGIYTVMVTAVDAEQKVISAQYRLPVTAN